MDDLHEVVFVYLHSYSYTVIKQYLNELNRLKSSVGEMPVRIRINITIIKKMSLRQAVQIMVVKNANQEKSNDYPTELLSKPIAMIVTMK